MKHWSFDKTDRCIFSISDLTQITNFERAISIRLYNLITLQFILRFPMNSVFSNDKLYSSHDCTIFQNDLWQS